MVLNQSFLNQENVPSLIEEGMVFADDHTLDIISESCLFKTDLSSESINYYMNPINAYIDAEWASDDGTVCLQVLLHSFTSPPVYYIVMNEKYRDFMSQKGYVEGTRLPFYGSHLLFSDFDAERDNLTPLIRDYCSKYGSQMEPSDKLADDVKSDLKLDLDEEDLSDVESIDSDISGDGDEDVDDVDHKSTKKSNQKEFVRNKLVCNLYLFYSPKDVWIGIGYKNFFEVATTVRKNGRTKLEQKRNLSGRFVLSGQDNFIVQYTLKDISGWTNQSLSDFAAGLNIDTKDKGLLDEYKSIIFSICNLW